ncbi:hypothetical protein DFH28DRAFT_856348, partial [Melampsora americana]
DIVGSFCLEDMFWEIGFLTHPTKAWATDPETKIGIDFFLTTWNCEEELHRIVRKVCQRLCWGLDLSEKIQCLKNTL